MPTTIQASNEYGHGSESSTMNSLRASVSRARTSSFCATERLAFCETDRGGATMFDRNNSLPLSLLLPAERHARIHNLIIKACMRGAMRRLAEWLSAAGGAGNRPARNSAG